MAGGTWTIQNKDRPGVYDRVRSNGSTGTSESVSGVMVLPLALDFGPENEVVEINGTTDLTPFGYDLGHEKMILLHEALKRAATVLVYRIGSGIKSSIKEGSLTITALYGGKRGDDINVVSKANVNVPNAFDVETYLAGRLVDSQTVETIEELQSNQVVSFAGTGKLTVFTAKLTGGTNAITTVNDYMTFFNELQVFEFNTMALPVTDVAIKTAGISFINRMRNEEGMKCQIVVSGVRADNEAVINVKNGVILADGTVISADQATAWVAGASAAADIVTTLTHTAYEGAVDVTQRYRNTEIIEALRQGEFVFREKQRGVIIVEQDINSFRSFTATKCKRFSKNRVLRVLDEIISNSKKTFEDSFMSTMSGSDDDRDSFRANRIRYFTSLQDLGAIKNFVAEDIEVLEGEESDAVVLNLAVQPVDATEKLYIDAQMR